MSIYKRQNGRYRVRVDLAPSAKGLRRRKSVGAFRTRKLAEAAERDALGARDRGIDLNPETVTFSEVAERFLKSAGPDLAPATLARYEEHLRIHIAPTCGGIVITNVKPAHLAELYAKLRTDKIRYVKVVKNADGSTEEKIRFGRPLSANSVLRVHRLLHRLLGWAESLGLVSRNVTRFVQAPKPTPSPARALTADQMERVLATAEGRPFHSFFVVAAETGMRRGEVGALTWDCIDFDRAFAIVRQAIGEDRKGGSFIKSTKSG